MSICLRSLLAGGIAGAFALSLSAAHAAAPGFCNEYAQAAVNQVRAALATPACNRGLSGARWSSDYRVHYDWCLTQPPTAAATERGARTGFIQACRGR